MPIFQKVTIFVINYDYHQWYHRVYDGPEVNAGL